MLRRSATMLSRRPCLSRILTTLGNTSRPLSTYYDPQPGIHVPAYNKNEISIFLNASEALNIPANLYKDTVEADKMANKIRELVGKGIHGLYLPSSKLTRDVRNLKTLVALAPAGFFLVSSDACRETLTRASDGTFLSQLVHYHDDAKRDLHRIVKEDLHSTLSITEDVYTSDNEAITLANSVASLIDSTGGCDFIILAARREDSVNSALAVCQELLCLDVTGPTIKSRLIVESAIKDVVQEAMKAGVNKFMIDKEGEITVIEGITGSQGKAIVM